MFYYDLALKTVVHSCTKSVRKNANWLVKPFAHITNVTYSSGKKSTIGNFE